MKVSLVGQIGKLARMVRLNRIEKARRLGFGLDRNHTVGSDGSLGSKRINGVKHNSYISGKRRRRNVR